MELSFTSTAEQATRLAERQHAVSVRLKREKFDALGLGLGLGDQREVLMDLDGREKLWRLVRVDYDPNDPAVVGTGWMPVTASDEMLWSEDDPRSAFPTGDPQPIT